MKFIKRNKRFAVILAAALLLLVGAVWLNVKLNRDGDEETAEAPEIEQEQEESRETMTGVFNDYFNAFRAERSELRAQEIEYLRSIINSENSDKESLNDARNRLFELVGKMEKEFSIESQIRGKGFSDAAATYQGNTITVVVDSSELSDEEVAKILDIVMTETGLPASCVRISLGS